MASSRTRTPRRQRTWLDDAGAITVSGTTPVGTRDLFTGFKTFNGASASPVGTVAAVRLSLSWNPASPSAIGFMHVGLVVAAAIPGVPQPITNPYADWMMNHRWYNKTTSLATITIAENDIYIKSQRKVTDPGQTLWLVCNADGPGTLNFHMRALFLLS